MQVELYCYSPQCWSKLHGYSPVLLHDGAHIELCYQCKSSIFFYCCIFQSSLYNHLSPQVIGHLHVIKFEIFFCLEEHGRITLQSRSCPMKFLRLEAQSSDKNVFQGLCPRHSTLESSLYFASKIPEFILWMSMVYKINE